MCFLPLGHSSGPDLWLVGGSKLVETIMFYNAFCLPGRVLETACWGPPGPFCNRGVKMLNLCILVTSWAHLVAMAGKLLKLAFCGPPAPGAILWPWLENA